jgi:hypothetical protein
MKTTKAKSMRAKGMKKVGWMLAFVAASAGCSKLNKDPNAITNGLSIDTSITNAKIPGVGSTLFTTSDAVVGRVALGLTGTTVAPTAGNFKTAVTQLASNLPQTTNPLQATGADQVPLLAYAACSDVKTGAFGITFASSVSSQKAAIVAAGVKILDQHVGGLASGQFNSQVSQVFSTLVDQDAALGDNTQITFISVCMAADTYGTSMRGM